MSSQEGHSRETIRWGELIPIFPLPNVVLMPRLVLPLHVFEPRYRAMTQDALEGSRLMAVAMLRSGYETLYHTPNAPVHETVCVGRICREEQLPDGRFNFLLQGLSRARIIEEDRGLSYRRAKLEPLVPKTLPCEVEIALRKNLLELPSAVALAALAGPEHHRKLHRVILGCGRSAGRLGSDVPGGATELSRTGLRGETGSIPLCRTSFDSMRPGGTRDRLFAAAALAAGYVRQLSIAHHPVSPFISF